MGATCCGSQAGDKQFEINNTHNEDEKEDSLHKEEIDPKKMSHISAETLQINPSNENIPNEQKPNDASDSKHSKLGKSSQLLNFYSY
jgi:hypothetical protein